MEAIQDAGGGLVASTAEVRAHVDDLLAGVVAPPAAMTREEQIRAWSTSAEARAGQDAALAMAARR